MPDEPAGRASIVDFASAKRRLADASRPTCPRCGKRLAERATRCPHCGVWYAAAPAELRPRLDWRGIARRMVTWTLLALVAALTLVGIYATLFAPAAP